MEQQVLPTDRLKNEEQILTAEISSHENGEKSTNQAEIAHERNDSLIKNSIGFKPIYHDDTFLQQNKQQDIKNLSLSRIYQSKRDREREVKHLHTRIKYLLNEEHKKVRKIQNERKLAQLMFENKLEQKKMELSIQKIREAEAIERKMAT